MLTPSALTGTITITTDVPVFTDTVTDREREIDIQAGGYLRIVSVTDAQHAAADVLEDLPTLGPFAATTWRITGTPVEVVTPYQDDEVFEVQCDAQSADVLYFCHKNYPVHKLIRVTETSFLFSQVHFDPGPTTETVDNPMVALTLSDVTGNAVTVTASAGMWLEADLGREIWYGPGKSTIIDVVSTTVVTVKVTDDFLTTTLPTGGWAFRGSPSAYLMLWVNNDAKRPLRAEGEIGRFALYDGQDVLDPTHYAAVVHGFRTTDVGKFIVVAGGVAEIIGFVADDVVDVRIVSELVDAPEGDPPLHRIPPGLWTLEEPAWPTVDGYPRCAEFTQDRLASGGSMIWMSKSGDYENFSPGALDNCAITVTIPGQDPVLWLKDMEALTAGSAGREAVVLGGADRVLTPDSAHVESKGRNKSAPVQPVVVGSDLLFVQTGAASVRLLTPAPDTDQWWAPSVSAVAEHLFRVSIRQMARLTVPDSILLLVRSDGVLLTDTWERPEKVTTAWAHQITLGDYRSVCVLPHTQGEEIVAVVEREIGGMGLKYIEVFDGSLNHDAALIYEGDAIEELRGLRHLEGQSVSFKANGVAYSGTVANGILALGVSSTQVEVGLAYASKWIPVATDFQFPGGWGSIQGRRTRDSYVFVRWYCTEGTPTVNGQPWELPAEQTTPYTGDTGGVELGWVKFHGKPTLLIEQATPFNATVLGVGQAVLVSDP